MPVDAEMVRWGWRLLLGQEPTKEAIEIHRASFENIDQLRKAFMRTPEVQRFFRSTNEIFSAPLFLLRRPSLTNVPWCFGEPSLKFTTSQLCTSEQMEGSTYLDLCKRLHIGPEKHRKLWEWTFILAALDQRHLLLPGKRGLGFGVGQEPLASAFAASGVHVTATDSPIEDDQKAQCEMSHRWSGRVMDCYISSLLPVEVFRNLVEFHAVDMNKTPDSSLRGFDFCWSSCALEHLGSIRNGLDFVRNSLDSLREGGVAVHTTEFNLTSNDDTFEIPQLCIPRKRDIELLIHELTMEGFEVSPLNLWPGTAPIDEVIDLPPYSEPHLKLLLNDYVTTSIGLIVTKR